MKKVLLGLGVLCIAGLVAGVIFVSLAGRDRPPPGVDDLAVERIEPAPEKNAYTFFAAASNVFYWPTNATFITDFLGGKEADAADLADLLSRNTEAFDIIASGIACPRCVAPEVTGFDTPLPHVGEWIKMGRVWAVQARYERLAGRYADATAAGISLLQFAALIQREPECLIQYLVGMALLDLGLTQVRDLARDSHMPRGELARLSDALNELGPSASGLTRALKIEYKVAANTIDQLCEGKLSLTELASMSSDQPPAWLKGKRLSGYFFQPNATKEAFANFYRAKIAEAALPYAEMQWGPGENFLTFTGGWMQMLLRPNAVGKIFFSIAVPSVDRILERRCRLDCDLAATRLLVACHQVRNQTGRFPDNLQSLTPAFLSAIPADPFDGHPFRYDPSRKILYSVGQDLQDSGGSTNVPLAAHRGSPAEWRWQAEDAVYYIEERTAPIPADDFGHGLPP